MRTLICSKCKDAEFCKIGNYKNILTWKSHPIATDSVFEALKMYSNKSGLGVVYNETELLNVSNKVIILYEIISNMLNKKKNDELNNRVNGAK